MLFLQLGLVVNQAKASSSIPGVDDCFQKSPGLAPIRSAVGQVNRPIDADNPAEKR